MVRARLVLVAGACLDGEIDVPHASDDGGRREDVARAIGETIESARHEIADRHRQSQLRRLPPRPPIALVSNLAFFHESAQHLYDEERVALSVPIEGREQLAS
jgi:hypothetical protein